MVDFPRLPPVFSVLQLDGCEDIHERAEQAAAQGAEEGALLWTTRQTHTRRRVGVVGEGHLYAALVLRPDDLPYDRSGELLLLAMLCAGAAVARHAAAMTDLRYDWPNGIRISGAHLGGVDMTGHVDADGHARWLVLSVALRMRGQPQPGDYTTASLSQDADSDAQPGEVLETYAREFLSLLNRWADDGFAPLLRLWRTHHHPGEAAVRIDLPSESLEGRVIELDARGRLLLRTGQTERRIALHEWAGLHAPSGADAASST